MYVVRKEMGIKAWNSEQFALKHKAKLKKLHVLMTLHLHKASVKL